MKNFQTCQRSKEFQGIPCLVYVASEIYLTIIPRACVGYETVDSQRAAIFELPVVFVDAYRLQNLWSLVYELIYHCLLANQNSGIAIYHLVFNNPCYYSTVAPFYHIRAKERAKYATLLHCTTGQKYGLKAKRQNGRTKLYFISGIINPLFDCLTYNTSGHFAHCSYFSSPLWARKNTKQLAKYPRVLHVKPSNKVYVYHEVENTITKFRRE